MGVKERQPGRFNCWSFDKKTRVHLGTFDSQRRAELAVELYKLWRRRGGDNPPPPTRINSRVMRATSITTGDVYYFYSGDELEANGFNHSKVCRCCAGKQNQHAGFMWQYAD